jgi:hypothetical protein
MNTFSVKNFEKFQHYKDRSPPWIKLYNELLDDYEFGCLPDASKMHLIAIWLLASRSDNKIPYDDKWVARRINANEPVNLALLVERGFILTDQPVTLPVQEAIKPLAECLTREEGETEKRRGKELLSASRPANDWFEKLKQAYPKRNGNYGWKKAEAKFNALVKTGVDPEAIITAARKLCHTLKAKIGTEYIPMPASWLNSEDFTEIAAMSFIEQPEELNWEAVLVAYKKTGHWSRFAGNDPSSPNCRCPPEILAKYGLLTQSETVQ